MEQDAKTEKFCMGQMGQINANTAFSMSKNCAYCE